MEHKKTKKTEEKNGYIEFFLRGSSSCWKLSVISIIFKNTRFLNGYCIAPNERVGKYFIGFEPYNI